MAKQILIFSPGCTGDDRSKDCATENKQELPKSSNKQSTCSDGAMFPHDRDPLFGFRWKVTFKFYFSFFCFFGAYKISTISILYPLKNPLNSTNKCNRWAIFCFIKKC